MSLNSIIKGDTLEDADYWKYTQKRFNIEEKRESKEEIKEGGKKFDKS